MAHKGAPPSVTCRKILVQFGKHCIPKEGTGNVPLSVMASILEKVSPAALLKRESIDLVIRSYQETCEPRSRDEVNARRFIEWVAFGGQLVRCVGGGAQARELRPEEKEALGFNGISVRTLQSTLQQEVYAKGHTPEDTVNEIHDKVILEKGTYIRCPRDGLPGAAYVDCLVGADAPGRANVMLSYTWAYRVGDIVNALSLYCRTHGLNPSTTYVWICCLCINQHKVRAGDAVTNFEEEFGKRVSGIPKICAMMVPWKKPEYLKRVWCVFELWHAIRKGNDARAAGQTEPAWEIIMTKQEDDRLNDVFEREEAMEKLWRAYDGVRVQEAQASYPPDGDSIRRLICGSDDHTCAESVQKFADFNKDIVEAMQNWVIESATQKVQTAAVIDKPKLKVAASLSKLLRFKNKEGYAETVVQATINKTPEENLHTYEGAGLMRQLGILIQDRPGNHTEEQRTRNLDEALRWFEKAVYVHQITHTEKQAGHILTLAAIGQNHMNRGTPEALDVARVRFREAWEGMTDSELRDTNVGALVRKEMADVAVKEGHFDEAREGFEKALDIYKKNGSWRTPQAAATLVKLAKVESKLKAYHRALDHLKEAENIRKATNTLTKDGVLNKDGRKLEEVRQEILKLMRQEEEAVAV